MKIIDVIKDTLVLFGQEKAISRIRSVHYNNRFSKTLGQCIIHRDKYSLKEPEYTIQLSSKLFSILPLEQKIDTIKHEVCHLVASELYNYLEHGPTWQKLALQAGCEPSATTCIGDNPFRRKQERIPISCGCRIHNVSKTKFNRIVTGRQKYYCKYCRQYLKLENAYARDISTHTNTQLAQVL